jgi:hypothetical protein
VTNTDGEATIAVRFFQELGSSHVAVLFVTVRGIAGTMRYYPPNCAPLTSLRWF